MSSTLNHSFLYAFAQALFLHKCFAIDDFCLSTFGGAVFFFRFRSGFRIEEGTCSTTRSNSRRFVRPTYLWSQRHLIFSRLFVSLLYSKMAFVSFSTQHSLAHPSGLYSIISFSYELSTILDVVTLMSIKRKTFKFLLFYLLNYVILNRNAVDDF